MATRGGLEPPMREPKSLVLPLHHRVAIILEVLHTGLFSPPLTQPLYPQMLHILHIELTGLGLSLV